VAGNRNASWDTGQADTASDALYSSGKASKEDTGGREYISFTGKDIPAGWNYRRGIYSYTTVVERRQR